MVSNEQGRQSLPLEGLLVVSLEQAVAAPFASRQLADLGARVIKVERPETGDFARFYDQSVRGMSSHFVWLNRSKQSIALDLKRDTDREALGVLVGHADVFIHNLRPDAASRLGLTARDIRERHPSLVYCAISGYGEGGPYSHKKAYDLLIQAEAGLISITGPPDHPSKVGISVADIAAGMYAYSGVLAALVRRANTGEGATIEVSMLEALAEWMGYPLYYAMYGRSQPARSGASHATISPYGPFTCAENAEIFLAVHNEREWVSFCEKVLKSPDLAGDRRFATNPLRVENRHLLDEHVAETFSELTIDEAEQRLEEAGIAHARLRDMAGLAAHPQLLARNRWRRIPAPTGDLEMLIPPATLGEQEPALGPIPAVGEHTSAICAEFDLEL